MTLSTTAPMKRALVRQLRATPALVAAAVGGFHQAVAPAKARYPFVTYNFVSAPHDYQWDGMQIYATVDVFAFAINPVDAENIDSLVAAALQDAALLVDGQALLYCRRSADISPGPDVDGRGRRIFQIGGSYRLITSQNF